MSPSIQVWLVLSYLWINSCCLLYWVYSKDKTAARLTLLYPFAPITMPLFLVGFVVYGTYLVVRTAIGGSTTSGCGGMGGGD